jgi:hypothetical protein
VISNNALHICKPLVDGNSMTDRAWQQLRRKPRIWIDDILGVSVPPQGSRFFVLHLARPLRRYGHDVIFSTDHTFRILYILSCIFHGRRNLVLCANLSSIIPIRSQRAAQISELRFRVIPPLNTPPKVAEQFRQAHGRLEVTVFLGPRQPLAVTSTAPPTPTRFRLADYLLPFGRTALWSRRTSTSAQR